MKKILTIDGGGIKGVFASSFLAEIEETAGSPIAEYFDLIAGTSTGGIIALCLGLGYTAKETLAFYEELGPRVFAGNRFVRWMKHWPWTKYDSKPLRELLEATFRSARLGDSKVRLVIPSTHLETGEVHIFKTAHHPKLAKDYLRSAVDVALATSSAPTFFPTHRSAAGTPLVDGGVWCNNPAGLAAVEALSMLGWTKGNIELLSVSCTSSPPTVKPKPWFGGRLYWATQIVDVVTAAQSSASVGTAQHLLGHDHVLRVDPPAAPGRFALDDPGQIESLRGLGASEARKEIPRISERFLQQKAATFAPLRTPSPSFS